MVALSENKLDILVKKKRSNMDWICVLGAAGLELVPPHETGRLQPMASNAAS